MKNKLIKARNLLLIIGIIYTLISILALTSYISAVFRISTTQISFSLVISMIWWQLLMIVFFIVSYVLYIKYGKLGAIAETFMGFAMLINVIINIISQGANALAIGIEMVFPVILIIHGISAIKYLKKEKKRPVIK